ncbi:zinc finger MYM-type protein 1-like [Rhopalosiphum maidis]|uniref:zinc finger MYM-type protein 1-like n=1 Tax=Rhopalosiphum maidis TaxID=43146 RepID=UPI000EFE3BDB|nr:zinc finger MYM-type protein 1-like [Rhopalosiphum maidis]
MKVELATQLLSQSVADVLKFCKNNLHLKEFCEADPTINLKLKEVNNEFIPVLESSRKTGFLGFIMGFKSLLRVDKDSFLNSSTTLKNRGGNRGGLAYPNDDIILICLDTEKILRSENYQNKAMNTLTKGFNNWKKAVERFNMHERSELHKTNIVKSSFIKTNANVYAQISDSHKKSMEESRFAFDKILSSIVFLAKQGVAIRGHTDESANFNQLLKLRSEDSTELKNCDITVKEQISFCLRTVDKESFEIEEYFIGFYETPKTDSNTLFNILKDILCRLELNIHNVRGQCFDGASNVSGIHKGLQARTKEIEPRALFVHCQAHSLNLVTQDSMQNVEKARDILNFIRELITFIKQSPKRLSWFKMLQTEENVTALRPFCPTRWTLRYSSLLSVMDNYNELLTFLSDFSKTEKNDAGCKAKGFLKQLKSSDTYIMLKIVINTISSMRDTFNILWKSTKNEWSDLKLDLPKESRKRKMPLKYDDSTSQSFLFTPESKYNKIYKEIIDHILSGLQLRFNSEVRMFLSDVEMFFIDPSISPQLICEFYKDDLNIDKLKLHRDMFHDIIRSQGLNVSSFSDVLNITKDKPHLVIHLTELKKCIQLILTVPVTTCTTERSFSMLRRLKNYMRRILKKNYGTIR